MGKLQIHDEAVPAFGVGAYAVKACELRRHLAACGDDGFAVAAVAPYEHGVIPPRGTQCQYNIACQGVVA